MGWLQGPLDNNAVLWLGLQAFWWNRAFLVLQILSAAALLLEVLSEQQRVQLHSWLADRAEAASQIRVPRPLRVRDIAKWIVPIIIILAAVLAGIIIVMNATEPTFPVFLRIFLILAFFFSFLAVPIAFLVLSLATMYTVLRAGQRYVPPVLAWALAVPRFKRSLLVSSFVLFLIASLGQLYLS